jgi:uncharacterized protein YaeQ
VVYAYRSVEPWLARLAGERIHRAAALEINIVDRDFLAGLVARLERRMEFDLSVSEQALYLSLGEETLSGSIEKRSLADAAA